jgi:hypothetical protein
MHILFPSTSPQAIGRCFTFVPVHVLTVLPAAQTGALLRVYQHVSQLSSEILWAWNHICPGELTIAGENLWVCVIMHQIYMAGNKSAIFKLSAAVGQQSLEHDWTSEAI